MIHRHLFIRCATALWIAAFMVLAGCGGGADKLGSGQGMSAAAQASETGAPQRPPTDLFRADRRHALATPRGDASGLSTSELFDWAESAYKGYFPSKRPNQQSDPYTYRYYPETGNYLGVAGGSVYVLGPISDGAILRVGDVESFHCQVKPADCALPALSLVSVSDPAPQALDVVMVKLANLSSQALTASITIDGVAYPLATTRSGPANSVGVVPPIWFSDVARSQTRGYTGTVRLSQGDASVAFVLNVVDLPTLADFGASTGEITRAVIVAAMQSHGRTMNLLQSLRACGTCAGMTAVLQAELDAAIASRSGIVANLAGLGRSVQGLALGQSVSGYLSTGGKDLPLTLNRNAIELSDRILGSLIANVLAKSGGQAAGVGMRTALGTGPAQRRAQAIDLKNFYATNIAPLLTGAASGAKIGVNGANLVNGQQDFWDTVVTGMKTLGPVLAVAEAGLVGVSVLAAGTAAGAAATVAAPVVGLGAVVLGAVVGAYSLGNAMANGYDYIVSTNAAQQELAFNNMRNSFADTVGGLVSLAAGPTKAAEAVGAKITYEAGGAGIEAGRVFDTANALYKMFDWMKHDAEVARAMPPPSTTPTPGLREISFTTNMGTIVDAIPPLTSIEASVGGQKVVTTTVAPSNGMGTAVVPPAVGTTSRTTWRANDPVTGDLLALLQSQGFTGISIARGCGFAGGYTGTFSGADRGTAFIAISANGQVSGSAQSERVGAMSVSGSVTPDGTYDSRVGGSTSTGAGFGGVLQSSNVGWQIVGQWTGATGATGAFQLTHNCGGA